MNFVFNTSAKGVTKSRNIADIICAWPLSRRRRRYTGGILGKAADILGVSGAHKKKSNGLPCEAASCLALRPQNAEFAPLSFKEKFIISIHTMLSPLSLAFQPGYPLHS